MHRLLLLVIFALAGSNLSAQVIYQSPEELLNISKNLRYLEDVNDEFNVIDLLASDDFPFIQSDGDILNFKHTNSRYWIKFNIENQTSKELFLHIKNPQITDLKVLVESTTGKINTMISGTSVPHENRHLKASDFTFSLGTTPKTVLISAATQADFYLPIYIGAPRATVRNLHHTDIFNGIYLGIIICMILYSFIIFFATREKVYLYYVLHLFVYLMIMLRFRGIGFDLVWSKFPWMNSGSALFLSLSLVVSILFSTEFLDTQKYSPSWHNAFKVMAFISGLMFIFAYLNIQPFTNIATQILAVIVTFALLFIGIYHHFLGNKIAKYYFIAWSSLLISNFVLLFALNGILEINFWTIGSTQIGNALEAILLTLALAAKLKQYKSDQAAYQESILEKTRENERLVKRQNVILEQKVKERTKELTAEKAKSDDLLLNILPKAIADELKNTGKATPRLHEQVSVMFVDIKGFTSYSERVSPSELVGDIDRLFRGFDKIIEKYNIEKIKTIGDAYLCAAGLQDSNSDHAFRIIQAAKDILEFVETEQQKDDFFKVRVGIHSGSLIAGVVGKSKFAYDIWGDTVNVAARMEQHGEEGKINVSENVYSILKDKVSFSHRGKLPAKNKGEIDMYFCEG